MSMPAARSSYNGDVLFLLLILFLVASQPVFSFGLAPVHRHKTFSSVSSRRYFSWRYQDHHPRRSSGSGVLLPPLFATTEDTGADSSKNTTTTAKKSPPKTNKPKRTTSTQKSAKKTIPISHLANDANLSSWTENNPTWVQNIAALLEYNATHGTVNLPESSKEYPNLSRWVYNLRQQKGRLSKEQIQQLDGIGFLWKDSKMSKDEQKWHEMFMRLQAFKEKYGDCLVPNRFEPDPKLGRWVTSQRRAKTKGTLRKGREDMLDSIGFVWRLKPFKKDSRPYQEELWEKRYQELIEFKGKHNHTNVPQEYQPNKELGLWVYSQRERNKDGTLRKDRIPRLDKIGFIWEFEPIWDESWLEQYEGVKKYYQELAIYKEMLENSSEGSVAATKPVLALRLQMWSANQRTINARGDLASERKAMLDDIGFDWWE